MCRWYFAGLLFGVAFTVALAEALSRVFEEDQIRRRLVREQRHIREAEDTAATAWSHN